MGPLCPSALCIKCTRGLIASRSATRLAAMSAQLAEQLLAVIWLDRCRQVQLLSQGRALAFRVEMTRALLIPFVVEQRWGFGPDAVDDEGDLQVEGILNFDPTDWVPGEHHAHWVEELILTRIMSDIGSCTWHPIHFYMQRIEFFWRFPPGSLRRLPEGAPMR
jgi:hypothetical protein